MKFSIVAFATTALALPATNTTMYERGVNGTIMARGTNSTMMNRMANTTDMHMDMKAMADCMAKMKKQMHARDNVMEEMRLKMDALKEELADKKKPKESPSAMMEKRGEMMGEDEDKKKPKASPTPEAMMGDMMMEKRDADKKKPKETPTPTPEAMMMDDIMM